jgi:hypothetical protein
MNTRLLEKDGGRQDVGMGSKAQRPDTPFGGALHDLLERRGFNKQKLATAIDVAWSTVNAWGSPSKLAVPERAQIDKIAEALHLTAAEQQQLEAAARVQERQRMEVVTKNPPSKPTKNPTTRERVVEYEPRYFNARVAVADLEQEGARLDPEVIEAVVNAVALSSRFDPLPEFWRERLLAQQKLHEEFTAATIEQVRAALGGRAVLGDEVAKPKVGQEHEDPDDSGIRENGGVLKRLKKTSHSK